jgi:beta-N-acetylhexosaminidase
LDRHISEVIGDRAFHRSPQIVSQLAQAYQRGMNLAGMSATGKHFPGHGAVAADSHVGFPVDDRSLQDIMAEDAIPFERLISNGLAGIMPAHVVYPNVDQNPAGFSPFWLKQVLREQLGFQGVIFSDDLSMEAASVVGDVVDRAKAAINAGCDMALVCNNTAAAEKVLDQFGPYNEPVSTVRLVRMHGRNPIKWDKLHKDPQWSKAVSAVEQFAAGDSLELEL